jgi:hypothetical protein
MDIPAFIVKVWHMNWPTMHTTVFADAAQLTNALQAVQRLCSLKLSYVKGVRSAFNIFKL